MRYTFRKSVREGLDYVLPYAKDKVDYENIEKLTGVREPVFEGKFGEVAVLYAADNTRIFLLGLGENKDQPRRSDAFRSFAFDTKKFWKDTIQVDVRMLDTDGVMTVLMGLEMSDYVLNTQKTDTNPSPDIEICLITDQEIQSALEEGTHTGMTINRIKALVDAPANKKTPEFLARWAEASAKEHNYTCTIWDPAALKTAGFGAILAVGAGSVHEPRLIQVAYRPRRDQPYDIGLVGKGITFDSGGLSIKEAQNLHYMKSDMGGAAVVLGVVELAARLRLNVNIVGVIAAAENAVDGHSYRPGDIITSFSGKTIEVIDTDAEGRLVLADALSYTIREHQPRYMIDVATLTGSVVRTLGYAAAGIFSKNQEMVTNLGQIGDRVHERVWHLPLYDDYMDDIGSDVADIRNLGSKPLAGGSVAAKFLEFFTEEHDRWLHLDIAGVAFGDSKYAKMKSASGYGVRLLIEFIKSLTP